MTGFQINLVCCTDVICDEVAAGISQKSVALTYAMAIKSEAQNADKPDWRRINEAILARWKMSGLERIKKRAFGILDGRVDSGAVTNPSRDVGASPEGRGEKP